MNGVLAAIRKELIEQADEKTRESFQRFFKETAVGYGVKTSLVNGIARKYFKQVKPLGKQAVFVLCEDLLKTDYMEDAFIAAEWAYWSRGEYETSDFKIFEGWINKYINNWAKCDSLCNHAVGSFIEKYPEYITNLKTWTKSENRWVRRASSVTLIIPAKKGKFLEDIFEIADSLLEDKDYLVQKGYGWMLKEAGRLHQREVFDYILRNKRVMPRTALRYAIEKMPEDMRKQAMGKDPSGKL